MNKYYIFEYEVNGMPTFGMFPLGKECSMQTSYYNPLSDELVLVSKDVMQELKFVEKYDEFGNKQSSKGKPLYERRTLDTNLNFRLSKGEMFKFLDEFAYNPDVVNSVLEKIILAKDKQASELPQQTLN
jgi:hypothetical protein